MGNFGFKVSTVVLRGEDWHHYNGDEYEGHDPAFLGRPHLLKNGIDEGGVNGEFGNPYFTEEMLDYWPDSDPTFVGRRFTDGIDGTFPNGEGGSPVITEDMVATAASDPFHRYTLENGIVLWGVTEDRIGKKYADGIDNNFDGQIDESIDEGIDDLAEAWYDGVDNDGDGEIDEQDERGTGLTNPVKHKDFVFEGW